MSSQETVLYSRSTPSPFRVYELPGALQGSQELILNLPDRIATLMDDSDMIAQACLPAQAWALLLALLDTHPASCSQAVLYATWAGVTVDVARGILKALFDAGVHDLALGRLDEVLACCRAHLALFNLGIQPVPEEEGYRLFRLTLV